MTTTALEQHLLSVYRHAIRQNNRVVADHLLSAIEACVECDATMNDAVIQAYCDLAASASASPEARLTGLKPAA